MIPMTDAIAIADRLLDPTREDFDPIEFHNVGAVSEVIEKLISSKRDEIHNKGLLLYTALNYYHIGRNS